MHSTMSSGLPLPVLLALAIISVIISPAWGTRISTVSRRWGTGGPCKQADTMCMCEMAVKYTNAVRAKRGLRPLQVGSIAMYENARRHSESMAKGAPFDHQPIEEGVRVAKGKSCEVELSAENIAQNNVPCSGPADPAKICVDAWEDSPGHLSNMLDTGNVNTAIGIYIDREDQIWCTQTFSRKSASGTGVCKRAISRSTSMSRSMPSRGGRAPEQTPVPGRGVSAGELAEKKRMDEEKRRAEQQRIAREKKKAAMRRKAQERRRRRAAQKKRRTLAKRLQRLKHSSFAVAKRGGKGTNLIQRCSKYSGLCRFCLKRQPWRCFSAKASRYLDRVFTSYGL